jgi:hypothetical protein
MITEILRKAMDRVPDREIQNDIILATLGRLVMGEWGQMAENIGCLVRTGTVISDPAVRVRREYLSAPKYAGKPEGFDFAPVIEDALENGESFDRQDPLLRAYIFGTFMEQLDAKKCFDKKCFVYNPLLSYVQAEKEMQSKSLGNAASA